MAPSLAVSATAGTGCLRGDATQSCASHIVHSKSWAVSSLSLRRQRCSTLHTGGFRLRHHHRTLLAVKAATPGADAELKGLHKLRIFATVSPIQPTCVGAKEHFPALDARILRTTPIALAAACLVLGLAGPASLPALASSTVALQAYGDVAFNVELGVQLIYLGALLALLGSGSFLVVRQALMRRELENAAKELQERVRSGQATSEEYFELGAVMLRKKFFNLSNKYLEQAIKKWDGDEAELAQVHNALGFSYFSEEKVDQAITQYEKAVKLQPGYVTAWNNLGDAYEGKKSWAQAVQAYEEALKYDPNNRVASGRLTLVRERLDRFRGVVSKSE